MKLFWRNNLKKFILKSLLIDTIKKLDRKIDSEMKLQIQNKNYLNFATLNYFNSGIFIWYTFYDIKCYYCYYYYFIIELKILLNINSNEHINNIYNYIHIIYFTYLFI